MSKKDGLWNIYEKMASSPLELVPSTPISGKGGSDSVLRTPDSGEDQLTPAEDLGPNWDPNLGGWVYPTEDGWYVLVMPDGAVIIFDENGNVVDVIFDNEGEEDGDGPPLLPYDFNGDGVQNVDDIVHKWWQDWMDRGFQGENPFGWDPTEGWFTWDSDGDGVPDQVFPIWELQPPYDLPGPGDWWYDDDGDGVFDDPGLYYPDDDGPSFGEPIDDFGTVPWDMDGDGRPDFWLTPNDEDNDGDGVSDGWDVRPAGGYDYWGSIGEESEDTEESDIRERRRHLSAAERRRRAKYRKTASFKKAQKRYNKKTSRAGYRPSKTRSKASKKAARYRKRY